MPVRNSNTGGRSVPINRVWYRELSPETHNNTSTRYNLSIQECLSLILQPIHTTSIQLVASPISVDFSFSQYFLVFSSFNAHHEVWFSKVRIPAPLCTHGDILTRIARTAAPVTSQLLVPIKFNNYLSRSLPIISSRLDRPTNLGITYCFRNAIPDRQLEPESKENNRCYLSDPL